MATIACYPPTTPSTRTNCVPLQVPHGDGFFLFRLPTPRYDRTIASWFMASEPHAAIPGILAERLLNVVRDVLKRVGHVDNFPEVLEWHYQYDKLNEESVAFREADCRMRPYFMATHGATKGADCCTCCCLHTPLEALQFKLVSFRHEEMGKVSV